MTALRVRQIVAAVGDLDAVAAETVAAGLPFVHVDPGVGAFGAKNSLHRAGDTFVELLAEKTPGSAVGRHLERLGADGGYMVIVQVDDLDHHLGLVERAGIRLIWQGSVEGIRGAHVHPNDIGGAIVSLDEADPPESWPWCGPEWTGAAGASDGEPITAIDLAVADPAACAERWAHVLDAGAEVGDGFALVAIDGTDIRFGPSDGRPDRLVGATVPGLEPVTIGGLRFSPS